MSEKKQPGRRQVQVAIAYPPHVSLLPPEVGQRKNAARARGRAIFVAFIALAVAILAAVGANLYSLQRTLALDSARSLTLSLTTQQGEYSEVRSADQLLKSTQSARIFALSTEVSVKSLMDDLNSRLSDGMEITDYNFGTGNPLQTYGQVTTPLTPVAMADFSLEVTADSIAAIDEWVRKLPTADGVRQATLSRVTSDETLGYQATVTVLISQDALLHRFDGVVAEDEVGSDESDSETNGEGDGS